MQARHPSFRCRLVAAGCIAFSGSVAVLSAHDGPDHQHPPRQVKPAEFCAPSPIPDRIILTWTQDPATTQAVTWRTSTDIVQGVAEIAVADAGPYFPKKATRVLAQGENLKTDINEARFHTAEFTALSPNTKYAYRVGDGVNWSEWFHFTTASDKPAPSRSSTSAMPRTMSAACGRG